MVSTMRFALPALLAFAIATLGAAGRPSARVATRSSHERAHAGEPSSAPGWSASSCGPGTLPDGDVCVHIGSLQDDDDPDALVSTNAHHERSGRWAIYDQIPRRPDRPADYDAYRYPVPPGIAGGHSVVSGYDLDRPDESQRRGRKLHAVGHGGVDLPQAKGSPITLVALEHQQGDADVVYVGPLFGNTVITRHTLREAGRLRDYLVLFGHLDAAAAGVVAGGTLKNGDLVGTVGDTGSPELVHLHLEVRRVRDGVDVGKRAHLGPAQLLENDVSVVCDPRNVLPLQ
jgi:murein DD-endopeptidase MepM/ murein hydrolase activator NlpD